MFTPTVVFAKGDMYFESKELNWQSVSSLKVEAVTPYGVYSIHKRPSRCSLFHDQTMLEEYDNSVTAKVAAQNRHENILRHILKDHIIIKKE